MLASINNGVRGMSANSLMLDVVSQNLSNMETEGYKKSLITFRETMYRKLEGQGLPVNTSSQNGMYIGGPPLPVLSTAVERNMEQGNLKNTGRDLDLAINGKGFLRVELPDGRMAYTRAGSLQRDSQGYLVTANGYRLNPGYVMADTDKNLKITANGEVSAEDAYGAEVQLGRLSLYSFNNPGRLEALGGNLYAETEGSGSAAGAYPGDPGMGTINQGYLEESNVEMAEEITKMILAQRAYQFNSKSITTADEMWSLANNIRR